MLTVVLLVPVAVLVPLGIKDSIIGEELRPLTAIQGHPQAAAVSDAQNKPAISQAQCIGPKEQLSGPVATPRPPGARRNTELVGQIGGSTGAVTAEGAYAYISLSRQVVILKASDPARLVAIGKVDIPPSPGVANALGDIAVADDYIYVSDYGTGLRVINAANPTAPIEVGIHDTPGGVYDVAVAGNFVYVADGDGGLRIINVIDPTDPAEISSYGTLGYAYGVAVKGDYAYVAAAYGLKDDQLTGGGLRIIDVANPDSPTEVGFYETPKDAYAVAVARSHAYVATKGGLHIINVADPAHPTETSFYDMPMWWVGDMVVAQSHVYLVDGVGGLHIIDITNPVIPTQISFYDTPGFACDIAVTVNYAYVADGENGLRAVNISDPSAPIVVGVYGPGYGSLVAVAENYAYASSGGNELCIINLANLVTPVVVGFYVDWPWDWFWVRNLTVAGDYMYVAGDGRGLQIIDVSNPTAPARVGTYDTPCAFDVDVVGHQAYVIDCEVGLRIVDVVDPTAPVELGSLDVYTEEYSLAVAGNHAYVAGWDGLHIVDVTDPANPVEVGFCETYAGESSVAVAENYAYVAVEVGMSIVDVTDPAHPTTVGFYQALGRLTRGLAVADRYAYIVVQEAGLSVIDVTDPTTPVEVGFYDTLEHPYGVAVAGKHVYVADAWWGLVILWFAPSASTHVPTNGGTLSISGTLTSPSDNTVYTFPAGVFTDTVVITHTPRFPGNVPRPGGGLVSIGHAFETTALYADTSRPARLAPGRTYTVTVRYTDVERGPVIESTLALYYWDGDQWVKEPTSSVESAIDTVTAAPDHLSLWAILGETWRMLLPLILRDG